jgi:hypothetical protein
VAIVTPGASAWFFSFALLQLTSYILMISHPSPEIIRMYDARARLARYSKRNPIFQEYPCKRKRRKGCQNTVRYLSVICGKTLNVAMVKR